MLMLLPQHLGTIRDKCKTSPVIFWNIVSSMLKEHKLLFDVAVSASVLEDVYIYMFYINLFANSKLYQSAKLGIEFLTNDSLSPRPQVSVTEIKCIIQSLKPNKAEDFLVLY